jgi:hypothetical protein
MIFNNILKNVLAQASTQRRSFGRGIAGPTSEVKEACSDPFRMYLSSDFTTVIDFVETLCRIISSSFMHVGLVYFLVYFYIYSRGIFRETCAHVTSKGGIKGGV